MVNKFKNKCLLCKGMFLSYQCQKRKYCSLKCKQNDMSRVLKVAHKLKFWGFEKGHSPSNKTESNVICNMCNKTFHIRPAKVRYGRGKYCSKTCASEANIGKPAWNKGKPYLQIRGSKNPNWKGGTTDLREKIRKSLEYEEWRRQVFERDLYTCQMCGEVGGKLNADHIKPYALFPELRLDISNGRTLCEPCHKTTPTYLNSTMRREDFEDGYQLS